MKIAMMTNNYKPFIGGVPISVERLSEGLRRLGHEVCIFAPEYQKGVCEEDVIRYGSGRHRMENGMVFPNIVDRRIREEFETRKFDMIHVHQPMLIGNVAQWYSRKYSIPLVFTWHTRYEEYLHYLKPFSDLNENRKVMQFIYEKCRKGLPRYMNAYANRCSLVFAPSGDMESYLRQQNIKPPVRVLPTGLSEHSFTEDPKRSAQLRQKLLGDRKYLLCTVSRIEKEKNLYFLINAAGKLKKELGDRFRIAVVGEGSEREALDRYVKQSGLEDVVSFTGGVPNEEVKDYLFASDLFLFASKSETQGIVLAEAMAAGLPVAAVRACGVNDIVEDQENGCLSEEDEEEFAGKVCRILREQMYRARLKEGAERTALRYRMEAVARKAEAGYVLAGEFKAERGGNYGYQNYRAEDAEPDLLHLFKVS